VVTCKNGISTFWRIGWHGVNVLIGLSILTYGWHGGSDVLIVSSSSANWWHGGSAQDWDKSFHFWRMGGKEGVIF
jgi:hypothetical protein